MNKFFSQNGLCYLIVTGMQMLAEVRKKMFVMNNACDIMIINAKNLHKDDSLLFSNLKEDHKIQHLT